MQSIWLIIAFLAYTALLFFVSGRTSRHAGNGAFFSGDHKAPWFLVGYGMVGSSISGVSFISVPGNVWVQNFFYLPLVFGFVIGYIVIAKVFLPLYYKRGLTSIYTFLDDRFGKVTHKTGTVVFMISRLLGSAVRIFVVILVLQALLPSGNHPVAIFLAIAVVFLALLYLYTYKGGVKTIIWTDVFQTTFMLLAVALTIIFICRSMGWTVGGMAAAVASTVNGNEGTVGCGRPFTALLDWDWHHGTNAVKQFISGIFITVAMNGIDQAMIQKSLACKDLRAAQKNTYTTAVIIVIVNVAFVLLGALLCVFASSVGGFEALGIGKTDELFPAIASKYFGTGLGVVFLLGLISSSYPSAGAAMTSLTTSVCVDFLGFGADGKDDDRTRKLIHALVGLVILAIVVVLYEVSNDAVVNLIYKLASYTYGPLLGMFLFGLASKRIVRDSAVPAITILAPVLCLAFNLVARKYWGFDLGFTLLIVNTALTLLGLWACSSRPVPTASAE